MTAGIVIEGDFSSKGKAYTVTQGEAQARYELAAAYRILAKLGMTDTIYTHISIRVPDTENVFLLNAFGMLYEEVEPDNLVSVTSDGEVLYDPTGLGINRAGFVLHGAIHDARDDVHCVVHTHTVAGVAVSAQREGLLPISQHAAPFIGRLAYHDCEGISVDISEQERLVEKLGEHRAVIMKNHGLLTAGRSAAEAVHLMIMLDRACQIQIAALSGGQPLQYTPQAAIESTQEVLDALEGNFDRNWRALLRMAGLADSEGRGGFAAR